MKWISTKDSLPEENQKVIIWMKWSTDNREDFAVAARERSAKNEYAWINSMSPMWFKDEQVLFWGIPDPPEKEIR